MLSFNSSHALTINIVLLSTGVVKFVAISFGVLAGLVFSLCMFFRYCRSPKPKINRPPEGRIFCFCLCHCLRLLTSIVFKRLKHGWFKLPNWCRLPAVQNALKFENVHCQISRTTGTMGEHFKKPAKMTVDVN